MGIKSTRRRVSEVVVDHVRQQLADGTLKAGDKLPAERTLALNLGVSRPAVREALRMLEMSGVLEFGAGVAGGAFVRRQSSDGMRRTIKDMVLVGEIPVSHLTEVRASLLGDAARLATKRASDADFALIRDNIDKTEGLITRDDATSLQIIGDFYRLIGRASHNKVLSMFIDAMSDIIQELLLAFQLRSSLDIVAPRREILAYLVAGDGDAAARALRTHLVELTKLWPIADAAFEV